jgi:hypothetical protein
MVMHRLVARRDTIGQLQRGLQGSQQASNVYAATPSLMHRYILAPMDATACVAITKDPDSK